LAALLSPTRAAAVGTRGADHNRSGANQVDFSTAVDRQNVGPEAAELAVATENEAAVMDSLILCKFLRGVVENRMTSMAEMLRLVTGWDVSADELCQTAGRIVMAKKGYNIRQGWTPAEDTLPKRLLSEPLTDGASQSASLSAEHLCTLVQAYNQARGWSDEGWIPVSQLAELETCGIRVKPQA
jgi:aldehyde:ferredoxin oxidoreductase